MHAYGKRNMTIQLNVTAEEKEAFLAAAAKAGLPLGTWCRTACVAGAYEVLETPSATPASGKKVSR